MGGLHQPRIQLTAVVTLGNGVAGQGWHPVPPGASGPAVPSAGLRASPCSAQRAHPGFSLGPWPASLGSLPLFAAFSLLRWGAQQLPPAAQPDLPLQSPMTSAGQTTQC